MPDAWDRFDESAERHLEALGFTQSLEVYEPTETPVAGGGYERSYPDEADATVDAEIATPETLAERSRAGAATDADVVIRVPNDTGLAFTDYGESGEAPARVVDVGTGVTYEVAAVDSEHNGLLRLEANEV